MTPTMRRSTQLIATSEATMLPVVTDAATVKTASVFIAKPPPEGRTAAFRVGPCSITAGLRTTIR